ncbi:MAG: hypothetical protein ACM3SM_04615 [Bacteroidota bacterium]
MNAEEQNIITVLEKLDEISGGRIVNREDIERLIEICARTSKTDMLDKAAFYARFLQGLLTIIRRRDSSVTDDLFSRYEQEYFSALENMKNALTAIIVEAGEFYRRIFEEKYFTLSKVSIEKLNSLAADLSWYKAYRNQIKNG